MSFQNCPRCKFDSLRLHKSQLKCSSPGCPYVDFSPITYENDVRNFEGEKTVENRFAVPYNASLENGGLMFEFEGRDAAELNQIQWSKQNKQTREYKDAQKLITKWGQSIKISQRIQELAMIRFSQINKLLEGKSSFKKKDVAAYALYNAAYQQQEYFIDTKLIKRIGKTTAQWQKAKRQLSKQLAGKIYIPKQPPKFYALKYCHAKKININQKQAIMRVLTQFKQKQVQGGQKQSTVAACAIWIVLRKSKKYGNDPGFTANQIAKEFENKTQSTVKKFYDKNVQKLLQKGEIIVEFQNMIK